MKSDMEDIEVENQILIAGAGPSGLALAAELSRRGVSTAIIDRQAAGANTSRACVVHARTMEVLEPLGVTRDLLAEGVKVPIFRIRDRDRPLLTVNFSEIPSSYQFTLMIPQNRIEQILLRHLKDRKNGFVVTVSTRALNGGRGASVAACAAVAWGCARSHCSCRAPIGQLQRLCRALPTARLGS
jgi:2-polyprenyl-6-methoxyphenol hydroxylase-like FAD-dependent oxidoreductase